MKILSARFMPLAVLALGVVHRVIQLWLVHSSVAAQAALNPNWHSMQYLPSNMLEKHLADALLYLQQTPPLPNLLVGILSQLAAGPAFKAVALIAFAGMLSSIAAALLALLLLRLRVWAPLAFVVALLFLGNSGVVLLEYTALGQCFYEQLTMVGCLVAALAAVSLAQHGSMAAALWLGLAVAVLALTRATFSYFAIPVVAWLLWQKVQPRYLLAFLLPVALLHGGWAIKQYWVQGSWLWATSSWGGANAQFGDIKRHGGGFGKWQAPADIECAERWPDVLGSPLSAFLSYSQAYGSLDAVRNAESGRGPSAAARRSDVAAYAARGEWLASDSAGFRELSACVQKMYFRYWLSNPDKAIGGWAKSYAQFWQPLDSYTAVVPTALVASRPAATEAREPSIRDAIAGFLGTPTYSMRQETMPWYISDGKLRLVPANVVVIPFAPQLATLMALITLHSLPLIALYFRIQKGSLKGIFPAGFSFLLLLYIYVAGICNLVEYGENMRFRLPVEPIAWSIGIVAACSLTGRLRRPARPSGG